MSTTGSLLEFRQVGYRYPDGSEYTGDFRNAKMHGQGTYLYAGRGEKYVGEWRNGAIDGSVSGGPSASTSTNARTRSGSVPA